MGSSSSKFVVWLTLRSSLAPHEVHEAVTVTEHLAANQYSASVEYHDRLRSYVFAPFLRSRHCSGWRDLVSVSLPVLLSRGVWRVPERL